jgi:hypothetical protein
VDRRDCAVLKRVSSEVSKKMIFLCYAEFRIGNSVDDSGVETTGARSGPEVDL